MYDKLRRWVLRETACVGEEKLSTPFWCTTYAGIARTNRIDKQGHANRMTFRKENRFESIVRSTKMIITFFFFKFYFDSAKGNRLRSEPNDFILVEALQCRRAVTVSCRRGGRRRRTKSVSDLVEFPDANSLFFVNQSFGATSSAPVARSPRPPHGLSFAETSVPAVDGPMDHLKGKRGPFPYKYLHE